MSENVFPPDHVTVLTGAASGIGAALAAAFGALGMGVVRADCRRGLDVKLRGIVHGIRRFMPILRDPNRPAHIVSPSSVAGLWSGVRFIRPYAVRRVGVVSPSETLRDELPAEGSPIGVSVLCPGSVTTNVMESKRSRPAALGSELRTPVAELVRSTIRDGRSGPDGKSPEQVAARGIEGLRRDRSWILTHASTRAALEARFAAILAALPEN